MAEERALEEIIAERVKQYRVAAGMSAAELAQRTELSKAMISRIEAAATSSSLTTLQRLAKGLGVPVTALFRGADTDREAVFTPAGAGGITVRSGTRLGHEYQLLGALRGVEGALEPTLVTLTERSAVFPLFQHPGTEFLYMLEGEMVYGHGAYTYTLRPGDSLLIDGEGPHGPQELVEVPIRFLAIAQNHVYG
ncbi:helix-turn-helix domain-containing protein [Salinibacterium soli]|uniref:XRE family transcriptional regulator n=1 Tax=Antiquaquibacter soli TaxID=3064523 RepID=A0ABT9BQK1_9MICO|nr:XRE family transcriptional regulator [Protaetiibacter sp. WY-16]MDO7883280.1 XRE family transcriptional regulator [Protaetiibacter sp. WY-16]